MGTHPIFESDFDCLTDMDKIIAALNEDASCKGWIICQQDGKIIDSVGVLEQKKEIAQSMHRIFFSLGDSSTAPRVVFPSENGHIMAYKSSGKIVVVQKSLDNFDSEGSQD